MTKRKIININEKKCNGCGECIPNCPEGAIQIIDGKARLISDILCDGLGACLGHCPEGAISIEEREAEIYDEKKVMENVVKQGKNTILAHLNHLKIIRHNLKDTHEIMDTILLLVPDEVRLHRITTEDDTCVLTNTSNYTIKFMKV